MILKESLVLRKTNADSLAAVRNLNLWGEGLTDVSLVSRMPNIEVLALAANKLNTLSPFSVCLQLRELYMRKNCVASLSEIRHICHLPELRTLWLMDNPCARHPEYRKTIICCCPHLRQLDDAEVTEDERAGVKHLVADEVLQQLLRHDAAGVEGHTNLLPGKRGPAENRTSTVPDGCGTTEGEGPPAACGGQQQHSP
ncbi:putative Leucine rich repeat [Trypanosoma vivax]|nr:putative Leucine rich repeat [Trypanosoma vivax]